jgi:hypothetical protein
VDRERACARQVSGDAAGETLLEDMWERALRSDTPEEKRAVFALYEQDLPSNQAMQLFALCDKDLSRVQQTVTALQI